MGRTLQNHIEAVAGIRTRTGVWLRPVVWRLTADRAQNDFDRIGEFLERFRLGRPRRLGKFAGTVANVSRLSNLRSDVIAQIAGEVQHQVAKAVPERERFGPELFIAE